MIQTAVSIVWVIFSTLFFGILAILVSLVSRTGNLVHIIARIWGYSILLVSRVRVRVTGQENFDSSRPYIFMSNHQSNFDIPVLLAHLRSQFRWLAKAELFKIPVFGRGMRGAGYIPIDRSDRRAAIRSLQTAAETIRQGSSVMIFPEGTRSLDGKLRSFKKGGFVLAVDAGVPIVPVLISGTFDIMPKSGLRIRPGRVRIRVLPPIETAGYSRKQKDELLALVRERMLAGQQEMTEDARQC
jgi:1-acyl-sn-glycerol-3-phosphate acyltransferase